jgi:hypothetical protein
MSNTISQFFDKISFYFSNLVSKIEQSPTFERLVSKYENSDPQTQKRIQNLTYLSVFLGLVLMIVIPVFYLSFSRSELNQLNSLNNDVRSFSNQSSITYKPAAPPSGWQGLQATNLTEFEQAVTQYITTMGIPQDLFTTKTTQEGVVIKSTAASLRQYSQLLFLMDGWYPGVKILSTEVSVNKDSREMIDFEMNVNFNPAEAAKLSTFRAGNNDSDSFGNLPPPQLNTEDPPSLSRDNTPSDSGASIPSFPPPPPPPSPSGPSGDDYDSYISPPEYDEYGDSFDPPSEIPPPPLFEDEL